jgi:integrase/recombinase XerD
MTVHTLRSGGPPMVHDYLERWERWMRAAGRTPATIRTQTGGMKTLIRHAHVADVTDLTGIHVQSWLADVTNPCTRFTYWMTVKSWVIWALAEQVIDTDLTAGLAKPRHPRSAPRPVADQVITQLLTNGTKQRAKEYIALAAYAGLRVHEIAKLKGQDVDRAEGWLYVDGKGGTRAMLPLHPVLADMAAGLPASGYWFPGGDHGHVSGPWVGQVIREALRAVGSNATAHQLRHSFGTAVLRSSHDLRVTQEQLRHSSPASTANYTQVADLDKVDAIRALGWSA